MIEKVEKLRTNPAYRNVGLSFAQAKTLVGLRDAADAAGQQRKAALLSKEEMDTSKLVGEFDFAVLDNFTSDAMRTELPSWDADQRSSPKKKKKTGQPKSVDGSVNGEFAVLTDEDIQSKEAQEKKKKQGYADSTWVKSGAVSQVHSTNRLPLTCQPVFSSLRCVLVSSASSALFARCLLERKGLFLVTFSILLQRILACTGRSSECTSASFRMNISLSRSVTALQSSTGQVTPT